MNVQTILKDKQTEVVTIAPDAAIQHAARLMSRANIGAIVVLQGETVIGMLTSREIVSAFSRHGWNLSDLRVDDLMRTDFIAASPQDRIRRIMGIMTLGRMTHMPVLAAGRLVGIISVGDVLKYELEEPLLKAGLLRDACIAVH